MLKTIILQHDFLQRNLTLPQQSKGVCGARGAYISCHLVVSIVSVILLQLGLDNPGEGLILSVGVTAQRFLADLSEIKSNLVQDKAAYYKFFNQIFNDCKLTLQTKNSKYSQKLNELMNYKCVFCPHLGYFFFGSFSQDTNIELQLKESKPQNRYK